MYVCICNQVTDKQLQQAVSDGAHTIQALQSTLGIGATCGGCLSFASSELNDSLSDLLNHDTGQFYAA